MAYSEDLTGSISLELARLRVLITLSEYVRGCWRNRAIAEAVAVLLVARDIGAKGRKPWPWTRVGSRFHVRFLNHVIPRTNLPRSQGTT
ncbi:MAG: hypothetical protein HRF42_14525 [Candidatus Brocadia sp.]